LGVFLNLPREKTVKYFFISMIPYDIEPKISQTKKNRALYHACSLSYFAREVGTFEKKRLYLWRPLYIHTYVCVCRCACVCVSMCMREQRCRAQKGESHKCSPEYWNKEIRIQLLLELNKTGGDEQ
jgi:hypothetical protein